MSSSLYLGLDLGTQGFKAVVYCPRERQIVSRGASSYGIIESRVPGRAEQAPSTWIEGGIKSIRQTLSNVDPSRIKAVGVSGQQHGMVLLDSSGKVLRNCKLWCDVESSEEAKEISLKTGSTMVPSFTATKLLWLRRKEPETWDRTAHVLLPHDYFNYYLTGKMVMECGDASGTGLFDTRARCWDASAIALLEEEGDTPGRVLRMLPPLIGQNDVVGQLREEVAQELGLPPGVVVSPGSGDNACSALGAGAVSDGQMLLSLGTSGTIFGKSDVPILDPTGLICPFADATGAWLPLLCTLNCTRVPEEVCASFGMSHEQLTSLAELEPPGSSGVSYLPYMVGERTPNWPHASGAILGLRPGLMRPGLLYRAALEGATFSLLAGMRKMVALGLNPTELRLVGGGSKNRLWRRIISDAFQLPIKLPLEAESAALGAAMQAAAIHEGVAVADYVRQHPPAMSDEVLQPDRSEQLCALYGSAFERHVKWGEALFDT